MDCCLKIQLTKVIEIPMLQMEVFCLNYDQKNHDTKYVEICHLQKVLRHGFKTHQDCCDQKSGIGLQNNNDLTRKSNNRENENLEKIIYQKMSPK